MAGAAIRKLRLTDTDVDVVLGGGIFRTRDREFFARIDEGLRSVAPVARPIVLHAPPVVGAALLGLDRVGGNAASDGRIRAAISDARLRRRPRRRGSNMDSR